MTKTEMMNKEYTLEMIEAVDGANIVYAKTDDGSCELIADVTADLGTEEPQDYLMELNGNEDFDNWHELTEVDREALSYVNGAKLIATTGGWYEVYEMKGEPVELDSRCESAADYIGRVIDRATDCCDWPRKRRIVFTKEEALKGSEILIEGAGRGLTISGTFAAYYYRDGNGCDYDWKHVVWDEDAIGLALAAAMGGSEWSWKETTKTVALAAESELAADRDPLEQLINILHGGRYEHITDEDGLEAVYDRKTGKTYPVEL